MTDTRIRDIFAALSPDPEKLRKLEGMPDPQTRYVIAITPRSGSSYLCDLIRQCRSMGGPGEMISPNHIQKVAGNIPGTTPDEFLRNVFRARRSPQSISGIKASWFQFRLFTAAMAAPEVLHDMKYIYLYRRNIEEQAVSLYRATATSVFHTNIQHAEDRWKALAELPYDHGQIQFWLRHIQAQEVGWEHYFLRHQIIPLTLAYEDIERNVALVLRRIAAYLGAPAPSLDVAPETSVFKKLGDRQSVEWACRYRLEADAQARTAAAAGNAEPGPVGAEPPPAAPPAAPAP